MLLLICLLTYSLSLIEGQVTLRPVVNTTRGPIKGIKADQGDYYMFLGIPYGQLGESPFEVAHPYPKFEKTFNAYDDFCACPQFDGKYYFGTLDCLCLHIFVPTKASTRNKLPVMVMIHGGIFSRGHTAINFYGPHKLLQHDVVFVIFNYRLGPYGWMCLDTPEVPGNQGLKDQLLAFRWIKQNIAAFGGDENKITLVGESSGSVCAEIHLLSKQELLFNRIILESGSSIKPTVIKKSDLTAPLKIAAKLGLYTNNVTEAMSFLSITDPISVIKAYIPLRLGLTVCVEKEFENVESILTEHPWNIIDTPKVKNIQIMAGNTDREGLIYDAMNKPGYYLRKNYLQETLAQGFEYGENFDELVTVIRRFYFGDEVLSEELYDKIVEFQSDFFFNFPAQWTLDKFLKNGALRIYRYVFSYDGGLNIIKNKYNITKPGAAHGDEVEYLFVMTEERAEPHPEDKLIVDRLTTLWTNFAKYGNPTPHKTELLPIIWEPVTANATNYLDINLNLSMGKRPFSARMSFWELVVTVFRERLKGYKEHWGNSDRNFCKRTRAVHFYRLLESALFYDNYCINN